MGVLALTSREQSHCGSVCLYFCKVLKVELEPWKVSKTKTEDWQEECHTRYFYKSLEIGNVDVVERHVKMKDLWPCGAGSE